MFATTLKPVPSVAQKEAQQSCEFVRTFPRRLRGVYKDELVHIIV